MLLARYCTCAILAATFACILLPLDAELVDIKGAVNNTFDIDNWATNRIRGISTTPVTARFLADVRGAGDTFQLLSNHLENIVQESNCALRDVEWISSLKIFSGLRDWPLPDETCVSSSAKRKSSPKYPAKDIYDAILKQNLFIEQVGPRVNQQTVKNFSHHVSSHSWQYSKGKFQRCVVQKILGVRYRLPNDRNQWYILSGLTNAPQNDDERDWRRQFIDEFIGVDSNSRFIDPLTQNLREFKASKNSKREKFSTSFELWGGRVGLSAVFNMVIEDVPALIRSLDSSAVDADQAMDATTTSNIAILALPMAMNLVPVSLLTDISTLGVIAYTILTDILTTVPFIIKGFELLAMSNRRHLFEETWYTGRSEDKWIVAETWTSECRLEKVRTIGVVFITVGFAVLVIGVSGEIFAHHLRKRWIADGTIAAGSVEHLKAALLQRELADLPLGAGYDIRHRRGLWRRPQANLEHEAEPQDAEALERAAFDHQVLRGATRGLEGV